jgi:hypothetical protein
MTTQLPDPAATIRQTHSDAIAQVLRRHSAADLIAEHADRPFGPHSNELARVLNFVRAAEVIGKHVIIADHHDSSLWHIATLTGRRHEGGVQFIGRSCPSIQAAEHAIFLLRLEALGITDGKEDMAL